MRFQLTGAYSCGAFPLSLFLLVGVCTEKGALVVQQGQVAVQPVIYSRARYRYLVSISFFLRFGVCLSIAVQCIFYLLFVSTVGGVSYKRDCRRQLYLHDSNTAPPVPLSTGDGCFTGIRGYSLAAAICFFCFVYQFRPLSSPEQNKPFRH